MDSEDYCAEMEDWVQKLWPHVVLQKYGVQDKRNFQPLPTKVHYSLGQISKFLSGYASLVCLVLACKILDNSLHSSHSRYGMESLTDRGQALYSLFIDVAEGRVGIAILHCCLSRCHPLPSDWLRFSLEGKWLFDVGLGCLKFSTFKWCFRSRGNGNLCSGCSVIGPIWEEIVFRGFLLPSLTKYIPVWCSILVSALVFSLAHLKMQKMLAIVFLGVVMGAVFMIKKPVGSSALA